LISVTDIKLRSHMQEPHFFYKLQKTKLLLNIKETKITPQHNMDILFWHTHKAKQPQQ